MDTMTTKEKLKRAQNCSKNPFHPLARPVSWLGWQNGFEARPGSIVSLQELIEYGADYISAFQKGNKAIME